VLYTDVDGHYGRWAKQQGVLRAFGHENGTKSVKTIIESCAKLGVKHLTLYAFHLKTGTDLS
jgi:undecaprenyl diphosphate synthase